MSVLILTLNESHNIVRCINSVSWSDDILVLDSHSADDTPDKAAELGARVYQRTFDSFADQRNYAIDTIGFKHDWVLHLDADEVVTAELRDEIGVVILRDDFSAYRIASRLMFMGKWLRYSGMYPIYQVRLGRKDALRFRQVGHGQREALEAVRVGTLKSPYLHFGFSRGIADWIERHNRYSSDEAKYGMQILQAGDGVFAGLLDFTDPVRRRRALKQLSVRLPCRPLLRFLYMYFLKLGFLDGHAGLVYCRLMSMYEYWTVIKMHEPRES